MSTFAGCVGTVSLPGFVSFSVDFCGEEGRWRGIRCWSRCRNRWRTVWTLLRVWIWREGLFVCRKERRHRNRNRKKTKGTTLVWQPSPSSLCWEGPSFCSWACCRRRPPRRNPRRSSKIPGSTPSYVVSPAPCSGSYPNRRNRPMKNRSRRTNPNPSIVPFAACSCWGSSSTEIRRHLCIPHPRPLPLLHPRNHCRCSCPCHPWHWTCCR
mmetsp:Transcript_9010/g.19453  ORF Transcript_9010/g.19453 Transcript_9010/m.19453 type:complete len:210 (-) Transcript_9010:979-1608(-)